MQKPARAHHTVPRFYLGNFGNPHRRQRLVVFEASERKAFESKAEGLTVERDFNRINIAGVPIDAVESAYSLSESLISSAIKRTIENNGFISDDDRIAVANLAALLLIRSPRNRAELGRFVEDSHKLVLEMLVSNRDRWEGHQRQMRANGRLAGLPDLGYDQMRRFVKSNEFDIRYTTDFFVGQELKMLETIPQIVAERNWFIIRAPADCGGFVTCDHPAVLMWMGRNRNMPIGVGMKGTQITLPLSPWHLAAGIFEGSKTDIPATAEQVAMLNTCTIFNARRQVYARDRDAIYMRPDGRTTSIAQLLRDSNFKPDSTPARPWY